MFGGGGNRWPLFGLFPVRLIPQITRLLSSSCVEAPEEEEGLQLLISDMCQMLFSQTAQRASRDKGCWMLDKTGGKRFPWGFALKWEESMLLKGYKAAIA